MTIHQNIIHFKFNGRGARSHLSGFLIIHTKQKELFVSSFFEIYIFIESSVVNRLQG